MYVTNNIGSPLKVVHVSEKIASCTNGLWHMDDYLYGVTHAQDPCIRFFQTQPTNQTTQFWSRVSVHVSAAYVQKVPKLIW